MHILVAEDDKISRELLLRILKSEERHSLALVADGAEAWTLLEDPEKKFDACILDIQMPGIDGLELAGRIRAAERLARTPIVLCTAANDRASVERAANLTVSGYIVKPYTRERVLGSLRKIEATLSALPQPAAALEDVALVCQRLGIDRATHATLLEAMLHDLSEWVVQLRDPSSDAGKLAVRADGLKGACLSLGANAVVQPLAALRPLLSSAEPARREGALTDLEKAIAAVEAQLGAKQAA